MPAVAPRVVLVTRKTDYEELLERHATRGQARFFLEGRGQDIAAIEAEHDRIRLAATRVEQGIPASWRRASVGRGDLDRFLFEDDDLIVAVGQDGLVANLAKYLNGQPVIGLNPLPERNEGVLVPHEPEAAADLLDLVSRGQCAIQGRTMVEAALDDGQRLLALNEVFVGHRSHQSARYRLSFREAEERQSSSGLIVATGTGSTGWARSIHGERGSSLELPEPEDESLVFFVREAFPSVATGTSLTEGLLRSGEDLVVVSEMNTDGVVFGDGIEADCVPLLWGQRLELRIAPTRLQLVTG